ncbi:MAG: hypothetical protein ACOCVF_04240 [bacterium]
MNVAKRIDKYITEEDQIKYLKYRVYLTHPYFKNKQGILVSLKQKHDKFWVYLDEQYTTTNGKKSRKRQFKYSEIKLLHPETT